MTKPIIFLGPSLPRQHASQILCAEWRPPLRRGDLADIPPGTVVGVIDGLLAPDEAISSAEVVAALQRGVILFGASSKGALLAAELECRGMKGVGWVYSRLRAGCFSGEAEVAVLYNPEAPHLSTYPLVDARYATQHLRRTKAIASSVAERLLEAARSIHFSARTIRRVIIEAQIQDPALVHLLQSRLPLLSIKRLDAIRLLHRIDREQAGSINRDFGRALAEAMNEAGP